jgi:hypothetical protein
VNTRKRLPIWILALGIAGCACLGITAQSIPPIDGVILLLTEDYYAPATAGEEVAVFGQLTAGGDPIPGSGFVIAVNFMGLITFPEDAQTSSAVIRLRSKADPGAYHDFWPVYIVFDARFPEADGADICYFVRSTKIITFSVRSTDLDLLRSQLESSHPDEVLANPEDMHWFWLTELPVDPPGEAGVAFF